MVIKNFSGEFSCPKGAKNLSITPFSQKSAINLLSSPIFHPIGPPAFFYHKTNSFPRRLRLGHEPANGRYKGLNGFVMRPYLAFQLGHLASQVFMVASISRSLTKARTTKTLTSTARGVFKTLASMMAPCSVKA